MYKLLILPVKIDLRDFFNNILISIMNYKMDLLPLFDFLHHLSLSFTSEFVERSLKITLLSTSINIEVDSKIIWILLAPF